MLLFKEKVTFQFSLKKVLWLKRLKKLYRGHVISDIDVEKIVGMFYEKELQKPNEKKFRVEKLIKRKKQ